jgi:hypothetical protein
MPQKPASLKEWGYLLALLILLQALSLFFYLRKTGQFGFPLDDAWIHQAYARNLGLHGVMAFTPGQPSTGSTSFGWTVLLATGYFLNIPFFLWTYFLGSIFAVGTALLAAHLSRRYFGSLQNAILVGALCILEWHLAWASVSGMEVSLFTFLTLLFLILIDRQVPAWVLGGLTGIIALVRPEGVILALVYAVTLLSTKPRTTRRLVIDGATFLTVFAIFIAPWILFNLTYSHRPFPNTIAAKFMQYTYPWSPWKSLKYLWDVLIYFLNGPLLLLVPGAGVVLYQAIKEKNTQYLYPWIWFLTLVGLYAIALPSIYDHGRYLMPLIPLVVLFGVEGLAHLLRRFVHSRLLPPVIWVTLFGMVLVLWVNGASDYAYRIRLFNTVHITAAQWILANTPPDAVIATHDIGIIGYYTEHPVVDLAGLVTPEVVPLLRNPPKMAAFLHQEHVDYVVVYSGYYRELLNILDARVVFSPGADELKAMGVEPFEIFEVGSR